MRVRWSKPLLGRKGGDVEDVQDSLAELWIKAGYVEPEPEDEPVRKAVESPPADKAVRRADARRK